MENTSPNRKEIIKALKKLKSKGDFDQMVSGAKRASQALPDDKAIKRLYHYAQAHYVNEKLHSDVVKELEKKQDYETLIKVYYKLLSVFPDSKELKALLKGLQDKIEVAHVGERTAYLGDADKHIREFIDKGEFDEAMQACYQMISYVPDDKRFTKLLKLINRKRNKAIEKELDEYFDKAKPLLQADFKANKAKFIRV